MNYLPNTPLILNIFLFFFLIRFSRISSDVIFPTDDEVGPPARRSRQGHRRIQLIPKPEEAIVGCSSEDTFCESVRNYPSSQVERAVARNASAVQFIRDNFDVQEPNIFERKRPTEFDRQERRVCDVIKRTIYPKAAKTTSSKWKYVVNTNKTYKQGIEIELCSEENAECRFCDSQKSRCVQTFVGKKLLSFNEENLDSSFDFFNFPASCVCYVTVLS